MIVYNGIKQNEMLTFAIHEVSKNISSIKCYFAQSCPTLCDPMDCNPPVSSVHGVLQARVLRWVAVPFFKGSSQPGMESRFPALQTDSLLPETPGKT